MVGGDAELGFCRHPSSEVSAPRFPVCGTIHHGRNLCRCTNINVLVASTSLRLQGRIKNEKQKLYALNVGCTLQGCTLYLVYSSRVQAFIKQEDNMKNWFANKILELADYLSVIGCNLRNLEYDTFCDFNDDCLCDDSFCVWVRNSPEVNELP